MYTCIGSWENWNCYPPHQDAVYTSPHGGHQKFQWKGGPRGGNFQGSGVWDSQGLFSRDFKWNKNYCFHWWSYINRYSWMLFSQLTCMIMIVYIYLIWMSYRLMNNARHPAHCFIFHNIIVLFTVLWSCSISLLLTCS